MKELSSIVLKELNIIKSQRMTLALIIIYPVLIIGALGLAFDTDISVQKVNVAMFIPSQKNIGSFSSEDIVGMLEETGKVDIQKSSSSENVKQFVKTGQSDFGLIVREEEGSEGQLLVDLVIDNSQFIVSGLFSPIAKAAIQITSFEVSSKIIQQLWNDLLPARESLQTELGKVDDYLTELDKAEEKIGNLEQVMSSINISSLENTLDAQEQNIQVTKNKMLQFNSDYQIFKQEIAETRTSIDRADAKLSGYHAIVSQQITVLEEQRQRLALVEAALGSTANNPDIPLDTRNEILQAKNDVGQIINVLDSAISQIKQVKEEIEESQRMLASMRANLDNAEAMLDSEKKSLDNMNAVLDETTDDLSAMNSQLGSLTKTVDEVNELIDDAMAAKEEVSSKLGDSKTMFNSLRSSLGSLADVNPRFLSRPIQAFEKNLYENISPLSFITPISLGLVLLLTCLLLTSVSIITEKREGAHLRMRLCTTRPTTLVFGKIVGQMIFAFLASLIILSIGALVFNVQLQANIFEIITIVFLTSFSFIALGLFISNFAKTQSTAILGSLILILPMVFLSGAILPLPLMNPGLQFASGFLPLTAANELLFAVMIKGLPIISMGNQVLILIIPAIALTAYSIKKF